MQDVLVNATAATVTNGGGSLSDTALTVAALNAFPLLSSGQQFRIVDRNDPGARPGNPQGPEIMIVTAQSDSGLDWTVTRGAEGSTAISHAPNWTAVPVLTAASVAAAAGSSTPVNFLYDAGLPPGSVASVYSSPPTSMGPIDSTNLVVPVTGGASGKVALIASFCYQGRGGNTGYTIGTQFGWMVASGESYESVSPWVDLGAGNGNFSWATYTPLMICSGLTPGEVNLYPSWFNTESLADIFINSYAAGDGSHYGSPFVVLGWPL